MITSATSGGRWNPPPHGSRSHSRSSHTDGMKIPARCRLERPSFQTPPVGDLDSQMGSPNTRPLPRGDGSLSSAQGHHPDGWLTGQIVPDNWLGTLGRLVPERQRGTRGETWLKDWQLQVHSLLAQKRTPGCACCSACAPVARDKWWHVSAPLALLDLWPSRPAPLLPRLKASQKASLRSICLRRGWSWGPTNGNKLISFQRERSAIFCNDGADHTRFHFYLHMDESIFLFLCTLPSSLKRAARVTRRRVIFHGGEG